MFGFGDLGSQVYPPTIASDSVDLGGSDIFGQPHEFQGISGRVILDQIANLQREMREIEMQRNREFTDYREAFNITLLRLDHAIRRMQDFARAMGEDIPDLPPLHIPLRPPHNGSDDDAAAPPPDHKYL